MAGSVSKGTLIAHLIQTHQKTTQGKQAQPTAPHRHVIFNGILLTRKHMFEKAVETQFKKRSNLYLYMYELNAEIKRGRRVGFLT